VSASFEFANSDLRAVKAATKFARFLLAQETLTPSQILAIARALYALQRLPEATPRVDVEFGAGIERGDSRRKENWNWHVRINHESFPLRQVVAFGTRRSEGTASPVTATRLRQEVTKTSQATFRVGSMT